MNTVLDHFLISHTNKELKIILYFSSVYTCKSLKAWSLILKKGILLGLLLLTSVFFPGPGLVRTVVSDFVINFQLEWSDSLEINIEKGELNLLVGDTIILTE